MRLTGQENGSFLIRIKNVPKTAQKDLLLSVEASSLRTILIFSMTPAPVALKGCGGLTLKAALRINSTE